jgi:hypothetical protein
MGVKGKKERIPFATETDIFHTCMCNFYLPTRIALRSESYALRQAVQRSPLFRFAAILGPRLIV